MPLGGVCPSHAPGRARGNCAHIARTLFFHMRIVRLTDGGGGYGTGEGTPDPAHSPLSAWAEIPPGGGMKTGRRSIYPAAHHQFFTDTKLGNANGTNGTGGDQSQLTQAIKRPFPIGKQKATAAIELETKSNYLKP